MKQFNKSSFWTGIIIAFTLVFGVAATYNKNVLAPESITSNTIPVWEGGTSVRLKLTPISVNSTGDVSGINRLVIGTFIPSTPITQAQGGTGGTNVATAQEALMLIPGTDIQIENFLLDDISALSLSSGDMLWFDGSNITNLASTTYGRNLLTAASYAAQLTLLGGVSKSGDTMVGALNVPYIPYSTTYTNNSNSNNIPTWKAIVEKIEALTIGAFISSIDTDFDVLLGKLYITNTVGSGRVVRESTLGGTNGSLSSLTDVNPDITNALAGEVLTKIGSTWSHGFAGGMNSMHQYEEIYTPITVASGIVPFTTTAINSGTALYSSAFAGRMSVYGFGSPTTVNLYSGALMSVATSSALILTNDYKFDCEFALNNISGCVSKLGYMNRIAASQFTNAQNNCLLITITNNTLYAESSSAGNFQLGSTPFTVNTNTWYRVLIEGTNDIVAFSILTNNVLAWSDTLTGTTVPSGDTSLTLTAGAGTFATSTASTNIYTLYINQIGFRYTNGF
jgi:hypothetical protein